ncbi:hypothetical protein ACS5PN_03885 [Roseateles sp. NT4]|uniref:hypothetical protein n=1 Tax=Roseateles sp. NT4 TaxID=3453715 RepID=UPI003EE867DB
MLATIKTKAGTAEVAADESGVVPGVVRVKVGLFPLYFSPAEAREIGHAAIKAGDFAEAAKIREDAKANTASVQNPTMRGIAG